jgi:biopolymer transport protein ExbD
MPTTRKVDMRFYVRKRRTTPAVIIVALIDVLIVLLIFLMVTTTFKQQQYMVKLAASSRAQKSGAGENPPLEVNVAADGKYSVGKEPKTIVEIKSELSARVKINPDLVLAINADEKAPWGQVVKIRDVAAEVKIKTLIAYTKQAPKP